MNLKSFLSKGYIVEASFDKEELARFLRLAERDIREASEKCHEIDWQFTIAYNAILQLASIALRASGFRATTKVGHHWVTLAILPELLGDNFENTANYFNECRAKRNTIEYCDTNTISQKDVEKILHEVKVFQKKILTWLKKHHPKLLK